MWGGGRVCHHIQHCGSIFQEQNPCQMKKFNFCSCSEGFGERFVLTECILTARSGEVSVGISGKEMVCQGKAKVGPALIKML